MEISLTEDCCPALCWVFAEDQTLHQGSLVDAWDRSCKIHAFVVHSPLTEVETDENHKWAYPSLLEAACVQTHEGSLKKLDQYLEANRRGSCHRDQIAESKKTVRGSTDRMQDVESKTVDRDWTDHMQDAESIVTAVNMEIVRGMEYVE